MTLKRKTAVFTIVQDEPFFLPRWVAHYGNHYCSGDIYILNHGDGVIETEKGVVIPVYRTSSFDHAWLRDTVQTFQRFLLQSYECVLFAEADEIIFPNDGQALGAYIDSFLSMDCHAVICHGYEVVHLRDREGDLDHKRPIMEQRAYWAPNRIYCKTLLSKIPLFWEIGFHTLQAASNDAVVVIPQVPLILLHLHRVDFELCRQRHERNRSRKWSNADLDAGSGFQNRLVTEDELEMWFYHPETAGQDQLRVVCVPNHIKDLVTI